MRQCKPPGCLTHPALCKPGMCPDFRSKGKANILSKIVSKKHGRRNQGRESAIPRGEVREAEEEKGCFRPHLGGVDSQNSGNRRERISENCPPDALTSDRQRFGAQ